MLTQATVPLAGFAIDCEETTKSHQLAHVKRNHFGSYTLNYSIIYPRSNLHNLDIEPDFERKITSDVITKKSLINSNKHFGQFLHRLRINRHKGFDRNSYSPALNFSIVFDENYDIFTMKAMRAEAIMIGRISPQEARRRYAKNNDTTMTQFYNLALHLVNQNLPEDKKKTDIPYEHATDIITHVINTSITKYAFRNGVDCVYRERTNDHERIICPKNKIITLDADHIDPYLRNIHRSVRNAKENGLGRNKGLTPVTAARKGLDTLNLAQINHYIEYGESGFSHDVITSIAKFKNQQSMFKFVA